MHIGVKSAALVAAVFVDFPKNKNVIFCTVRSKKEKKNCSWVQFLIGRRPPGAVATIALWKSAPMFVRFVCLAARLVDS